MGENMNKKLSLALLLILTLLTNTLLLGCIDSTTNNTTEQNQNSTDTGEDFTFYTLDGSKKHLSDYRGKVVILDLWATWCTPCQFQMFELRKAYQNYSRKQLEILSINIDYREDAQDIQNFLDQYAQIDKSLDWVFGNEKDNLDKYMPSGGIPTLCIFDQQGNLYFSHTGVILFSDIPDGWTGDDITLKEKIDELIT